MLWTMVRKELIQNLLELRFVVCAILCVVLGALSVFVLRADLATKRADFSSNRQLYRQQAEEYGSYRDLENLGVRIDRPPQDFQVLFFGMEKTTDRTAQVGGSFMPGFEGNFNANPMVLMLPVADMLFVVGVVLSLLAFFISYDAVSGERESGTLKLLMSYSVPRDLVILAKWIGGYISLALPFFASLIFGALLISVSDEISFTAQDWQAFVVSGCVSLVLIAVMFSIGLLFSVFARNSSTSILSLLAVWVLLALIVPNAGPYVAEIVAPVPDVGEVQRTIAERSKALNDAFFAEMRSMRGGNWRNMSREERAEMRRKMVEGREQLQSAINRATEQTIRDFERQLNNQVEVARTITRISPVATYVYANTDIGVTGVRNEQQLINSLRAYQRQFSRYIDEKIEESGGGGMFWGGNNDDQEYSIGDMPVFDYKPEELGMRLEVRSTDVLLLVVFAVLFFMLAFVSFLRTDIS
jgi:ABC-type transport system involved in multi-copper enzyme maturation permease subunit